MSEREDRAAVRVLLIEDDPYDAELTLNALGEIRTFPCRAERRETLSLGLERLSWGGVDLVLLDLGLPDSLGMETFERTYSHYPGVPIMILSGLADEELAIQMVKAGAQDYLVKGHFDGPVLARAIRYAVERHRIQAELQSLSLTDELTGLCNRRGFFTLARQQVKIANRLRRSLILIYADMDGLKGINDTLGHPEGDQALKDMADALSSTFRASDLVARLGGDEFAVLGIEESQADLERIRTRLERRLESRRDGSGRPYRLSFSMGSVRCRPEKPEEIEQLLVRADRAMYEEKVRKKSPLPKGE